MATKPTPGASAGTWGTEMNAFLDVSLAADGKIKTEALQTASTAPVADAALSNKKYVDDSITTHTAVDTHVRAWCHVTGVAVPVVGDHYNVTSVARDSDGVYTITWDTNFANVNYAMSAVSNTTEAFAIVTAKAVGTATVKFIASSPWAGTNVTSFDVMAIGSQ